MFRIEGYHHCVVADVIDNTSHVISFRLTGGIAENVDQFSALEWMWLIQMVDAFHFNNWSLAGTNVVAPKPYRIPGRSFFYSIGKRSQQHLLSVLFQIGLALQFQELEDLGELFVDTLHRRSKSSDQFGFVSFFNRGYFPT